MYKIIQMVVKMKKTILLCVFLLCTAGLFSQQWESNKTNAFIHFSGVSFSNVTSFDSDEIENEQLLGWTASTIREKDWGNLYSKFGIMYNFSAQNEKGVIGIPFPNASKPANLNSDNLYIPTRRGYAFRPKIDENTEILLIPSLGLGFLWTGVDYKLIDPSDTMNQTKYTGYTFGFDFSLGFDVSMMHNFSNMYLRYGIELNVPVFQLSTSHMRKSESSDGGVYYGDTQRASSNNFIGVTDVFKLEASPYIAIGFRFRRGQTNGFDDLEIERGSEI